MEALISASASSKSYVMRHRSCHVVPSPGRRPEASSYAALSKPFKAVLVIGLWITRRMERSRWRWRWRWWWWWWWCHCSRSPSSSSSSCCYCPCCCIVASMWFLFKMHGLLQSSTVFWCLLTIEGFSIWADCRRFNEFSEFNVNVQSFYGVTYLLTSGCDRWPGRLPWNSFVPSSSLRLWLAQRWELMPVLLLLITIIVINYYYCSYYYIVIYRGKKHRANISQ